MIRQRLDMPLQVKEINDSGAFSGYGSVFEVEDTYGDVVQRGAFQESLAGYRKAGRMPKMLWQHNIDEPIGVWKSIVEDDHGLAVEGQLLIEHDPLARRAHAHMQAKSLDGLSIGYNIPKGGSSYDEDSDTYTLSQVDLWEVSVVTFPANSEARIDSVKRALMNGDDMSPGQVERVLRDAGLSRRQAKGLLARGYEGLCLRDADDGCLELAQKLFLTVRA